MVVWLPVALGSSKHKKTMATTVYEKGNPTYAALNQAFMKAGEAIGQGLSARGQHLHEVKLEQERAKQAEKRAATLHQNTLEVEKYKHGLENAVTSKQQAADKYVLTHLQHQDRLTNLFDNGLAESKETIEGLLDVTKIKGVGPSGLDPVRLSEASPDVFELATERGKAYSGNLTALNKALRFKSQFRQEFPNVGNNITFMVIDDSSYSTAKELYKKQVAENDSAVIAPYAYNITDLAGFANIDPKLIARAAGHPQNSKLLEQAQVNSGRHKKATKTIDALGKLYPDNENVKEYLKLYLEANPDLPTTEIKDLVQDFIEKDPNGARLAEFQKAVADGDPLAKFTDPTRNPSSVVKLAIATLEKQIAQSASGSIASDIEQGIKDVLKGYMESPALKKVAHLPAFKEREILAHKLLLAKEMYPDIASISHAIGDKWTQENWALAIRDPYKWMKGKSVSDVDDLMSTLSRHADNNDYIDYIDQWKQLYVEQIEFTEVGVEQHSQLRERVYGRLDTSGINALEKVLLDEVKQAKEDPTINAPVMNALVTFDMIDVPASDAVGFFKLRKEILKDETTTAAGVALAGHELGIKRLNSVQLRKHLAELSPEARGNYIARHKLRGRQRAALVLMQSSGSIPKLTGIQMLRYTDLDTPTFNTVVEGLRRDHSKAGNDAIVNYLTEGGELPSADLILQASELTRGELLKAFKEKREWDSADEVTDKELDNIVKGNEALLTASLGPGWEKLPPWDTVWDVAKYNQPAMKLVFEYFTADDVEGGKDARAQRQRSAELQKLLYKPIIEGVGTIAHNFRVPVTIKKLKTPEGEELEEIGVWLGKGDAQRMATEEEITKLHEILESTAFMDSWAKSRFGLQSGSISGFSESIMQEKETWDRNQGLAYIGFTAWTRLIKDGYIPDPSAVTTVAGLWVRTKLQVDQTNQFNMTSLNRAVDSIVKEQSKPAYKHGLPMDEGRYVPMETKAARNEVKVDALRADVQRDLGVGPARAERISKEAGLFLNLLTDDRYKENYAANAAFFRNVVGAHTNGLQSIMAEYLKILEAKKIPRAEWPDGKNFAQDPNVEPVWLAEAFKNYLEK